MHPATPHSACGEHVARVEVGRTAGERAASDVDGQRRMSPSGQLKKRKRSPSPSPPRSKSPKKKAGKITRFFSLLTPQKKQKSAEKKEKKRLSFGAPILHEFDAFSPPRRRRPLADNADMDAKHMDEESLRLELSCRKEEDKSLSHVDLRNTTKKSMEKMVNELWNKDQIRQLEEWGVTCKGDSKLSRSEVAHKIKILHSLERKGSVLMSGKHMRLPSQMSMEEIREIRRIGIRGSRYELERRLEEAWLKEGERFDLDGEDGYAFGRWAISPREVIETMDDHELYKELAKPERKKLMQGKIPAQRNARIQALEKIVMRTPAAIPCRLTMLNSTQQNCRRGRTLLLILLSTKCLRYISWKLLVQSQSDFRDLWTTSKPILSFSLTTWKKKNLSCHLGDEDCRRHRLSIAGRSPGNNDDPSDRAEVLGGRRAYCKYSMLP
eukprot:767657-Hanusia_phi.AAC.3